MSSVSENAGMIAVGLGLLSAVFFVARAYGLRRREAQLEALVAEENRRSRAASDDLRETRLRLDEALGKLERAARVDPLTGLWNRRQVDDVAPREMERARRSGEPVAAILFDLDYFKTVNDLHGHATGDAVLVETARRAADSLRTTDWLVRWGGEEFLVLAPSSTLEGGAELAERIRKALATEPVQDAGQVTASFGVACMQEGEKFDSWIARADRALAMAKASGRNRVSTDRGPANPLRKSGPVVRLIWDSAFLCGDPTIDAQRQQLFALANEALAALTSGAGREELTSLAEKFRAEISRHYAAEEALLEKAGWDGLEEHRGLHAALLAEAEAQAATLRSGETSPERLFAFLVHDAVLHHFLVKDKEYTGVFG